MFKKKKRQAPIAPAPEPVIVPEPESNAHRVILAIIVIGFAIGSAIAMISVSNNKSNEAAATFAEQEETRVTNTEKHYGVMFPTQTLERLAKMMHVPNPQVLTDVEILNGEKMVHVNSLGVSLADDYTSYVLYTFTEDGTMEELNPDSLHKKGTDVY